MGDIGDTAGGQDGGTPSRVAITGVGVVSAFGIGRRRFEDGLREGRSGLRPLVRFDPQPADARRGAEVVDFNPEEMLGPKGLRLLDRVTKLGLCAAQEALLESGLVLGEETAEHLGLVLGATYGSIASRMDYYLEAVQQGPRAVNPALFPNTIANSPASQIAIRFGLRAFCTTVSSGFTSAFEAALLGASLIRAGRARAVLVGGVEELSPVAYLAFDRLGLLAHQEGEDEELCRPYDARRHGTVLGEAAALLVLEDWEEARRRGARIQGEWMGGAVLTDPAAYYRYPRKIGGSVRCIREALAQARLAPEAIDFVAGAANGHRVGDAVEARALRAALGRDGRRVVASALKSMLGETFSASGGLQLAAALFSLKEGIVPPTAHFSEPDARCPVDCVPNQARPASVRRVLAFCQSPLGQTAACVVGHHDP